MFAKFLVEFLPAFLGEENPSALELNAASGAGNVLGQPMRPFHVKIHIIRSPDDERRRLQRLQLCFNGERVLIVEGCEEALQVARALLGPDQRTQICFDAVVTQPFRVFIRWSQGLR